MQYHLRKYTLNGQFAFATKDAIIGIGAWLSRKARNLADKRKEAYVLLEEAGDVARDEHFIREQWRAQVAEQTRPPPSKSGALLMLCLLLMPRL